MTVRPLQLLGDPVLRTPCDPVTRFDAALAQLVQDLLDTVQLPGRAGGLPVHPARVTGTGELARCLQHETDHLNGELYVDGLSGAERRDVMRQIRRQHAGADVPGG